MQVFKVALRVFFKHPIYLAIYAVWLSVLGVLIGFSVSSNTQTEYVESRPTIAVIDRDSSAFSEGFTEFLGSYGTLVSIEDSTKALQDATAQDEAAYIVIIPQGFGADFLEAAKDNRAIPLLDTIVSYESVAGSMMNNLVDEYLNTARIYAATGTKTDQAQVIQATSANMAKTSQVTLVPSGEMAPISERYLTFMKFSSYTSMLSIVVLVAVVMAAFNNPEVRRRDQASPISTLSMNLQIAAACVVIMLITWAWICVLGLTVFQSSLAGVSAVSLLFASLSLLALCSVGLALGVLIGQLTTNELIVNACGNVICLASSFLGGVWVSLDMVGEPVATLARFTPTYYYGNALDIIVNLKDLSITSLTPVFANIGMILLFAAAIFAVALAAGRLRLQIKRGDSTLKNRRKTISTTQKA